MSWFVSAVLAGCTSFVATNVDDIVILVVFFSQVNSSGNSGLRPYQIVVGQYLGFVALLLLSLPGYLGGLLLPKPWLGLLGLLPIAMGVKYWLTPLEEESGPIIPPPGNATTRPSVTRPSRTKGRAKAGMQRWLNFFHPHIGQVALVTLANGGDNVGIYISLFANSTLPQLLVILSVFLCLTGCWCMLAYTFARHPQVAPWLTRHVQRVVPFVLIGLGIYILVENFVSR